MNPKSFCALAIALSSFLVARTAGGAITSVPGTIRGENPTTIPTPVTPDQVSPGFDPRRELLPCPYKIPEEVIRQILDPSFKLTPYRNCPGGESSTNPAWVPNSSDSMSCQYGQ